LVGLRPEFDSRLRESHGLAKLRAEDGCQFSFACEGKSLRVTEPDAWLKAEQIAAEVTNGTTYVSDIAGSTHYHANYVRPRWARRLEKMDVIGHHIFYKLRPGQS
jgi:spore germination cell wall hydrolase CwlJ-like protein